MKKSLYLKLSQQEANKKLQLSLVERHNRIKIKSKLLGWLYFLFAYIVYSLVAIVSFAYRLAMLPKDIRFTPHYMQTVIAHNNMSVEQANEYLISQQQEYKKSLSYGNFSPQERNSINTTFELLFDEYKLPEPVDEKHQEIITSISDVKNISQEGNRGILELNSNVDSLSSSVVDQSYTIVNGFSDIKQSIETNEATIQESVSTLSTLIIEEKDNITTQITEQKEILSNQLSDIQQSVSNSLDTSEEILESVNSLSEQNSIIQSELSNANQSINKAQDAVALTTDKINELSIQQVNNFSETQEQLGNINSNVESVKSIIEPVALYTEQKRQNEEVEEKRVDELRESQGKRTTTAYNREKGKKLNSFESALTDKQIIILVDYCNKIAVFDRDIEISEMKDILLCLHEQPLRLTVNKYLALLFTELAENKLICKTWKSVASRHNCFVSAKGKPLKSNDFYMANQTSVFIAPEKSTLITECINAVSDLA